MSVPMSLSVLERRDAMDRHDNMCVWGEIVFLGGQPRATPPVLLRANLQHPQNCWDLLHARMPYEKELRNSAW